MQNKKNKKQNGGEAEGKIIFNYVLLTFLVGFIGYCIYWCFGFGENKCRLFFDYLDQGKWDNAQKIFLKPDIPGQEYINEGTKFIDDITEFLNNSGPR